MKKHKISEEILWYNQGPSDEEIKKTINKFKPYSNKLMELNASVDRIDLTMWGKFPSSLV